MSNEKKMWDGEEGQKMIDIKLQEIANATAAKIVNGSSATAEEFAFIEAQLLHAFFEVQREENLLHRYRNDARFNNFVEHARAEALEYYKKHRGD